MVPHPFEKQDGGLTRRDDVLNFSSLPPEPGLRDRLGCHQRPLKPPWVGDHMDELGQDLGCERQRDLGRKDLALEKFVGGLVRSQLDDFQLN